MSSISGFLDPVRLADLAADPLYLPSGPNVPGRPRQFDRADVDAKIDALQVALSAHRARQQGIDGAAAFDDMACWAVSHSAAIGVRT